MSITILWWHIPAVITVLLLLWGAFSRSHSNVPFGDPVQLIAIAMGISVVWHIGRLFK